MTTHAPFEARLRPDRHELDVEHFPPGEEPRFARVIADGQGGFRSEIAEGVESLRAVLDVEAGPESEHWLLETLQFSARFPEGFVLHSVDAGSASPFDLVGPDGSLIYVQIPTPVPRIADMCGPAQKVVGKGQDWLEVTYEHEGDSWIRRHQILGPLVFTAQAREVSREIAMRGLEVILETLELIPLDDEGESD